MQTPQITVLDAGGQYCHLIARKVRDLGVYAEVRASDTPADVLAGRKGIIISGGPASVYSPDSPKIDPEILQDGSAVLGICYGHQLMASLLGGEVRRGLRGEYGLATLEVQSAGILLARTTARQQIWMSHRDTVERAPDGFAVLATTHDCAVAAMADPGRRLAGVQFHPEVVHTTCGQQILSNFIFDIARCERDWDPKDRIAPIEQDIRRVAGSRNVFFFVSGGVDSTVAYTLCLRALGPERVYGTYVDTGLMREGETEYVEKLFAELGATHFHVEQAESEFLNALRGVCDPEQKRHLIGEQFVAVQERVLRSDRFMNDQWILGQGTIYPDTIESGASAKADIIKTHHNRVAGIQKLIESGLLIEPLQSFYKDEVREIGGQLGILAEFLHRHPFPGPGLAIRCLCSAVAGSVKQVEAGYILPVKSVGVQGDSRSYRSVLALEELPEGDQATAMVNRSGEVNRVVARVWSRGPLGEMQGTIGSLDAPRLGRLKQADRIVREMCAVAGFDDQVWQFPVILVPFGSSEAPDSVVLRPVHSVDGMTAQVVRMPSELLSAICHRLSGVQGVSAVFYDLTNKPPGTIEWE